MGIIVLVMMRKSLCRHLKFLMSSGKDPKISDGGNRDYDSVFVNSSRIE